MIVTLDTASQAIARFSKPGRYAVDTETTGLEVYKGDELFSIILADSKGACYFNFQDPPNYCDRKFVLPEEIFKDLNAKVFSVEGSTWYIANAKFDMGMLRNKGIHIEGDIWDTEVAGRLLDNSHFAYGLDALLKREGRAKNDTVKEYIKKHKLYDNIQVPGRKQKVKLMHYDQVPFEIIAPYGLDDGNDAHFIGETQQERAAQMNKVINSEVKNDQDNRFLRLVKNESHLIKTCARMEEVGIKIDRSYCEQANDVEEARIKQAAEQFEQLSGVPLIDSAKNFTQVFAGRLDTLRRTKTGISFDDTELDKLDSPLVPLIRQHRAATKLSSTYYKNYLYYTDHDNVIHPNMRQAGTATGRFSYSDPNLQNVPKAKDEEESADSMAVRRCFVPREDYCFLMIDYDQMEYRLMLDYAREMGVIERVLGGLDVHQATADMMGVSRFAAKTINFMLLYGGGAQKLATALGVPLEQAIALKRQYFNTLTQVSAFIKKVNYRAEKRGYIYNWCGRPYNFPLKHNPRTGKLDRFAYKAPNYLIQGGTADIVRIAMNRIDAFIERERLRSRMVLQVHDELVFELHKSELDVAPVFQKIMEESYPHKYLPLTCGMDYSWRSWGDKIAGLPKIS